MKIKLLITGLILFFLSCAEQQKEAETPKETEGMHISVHDDSTDADVNISSKGIHVKTENGEEADVSITKDGINVKGKDGEEANVKMDANGSMDIKTKEGNTSVKMDKSGNMTIKGPDGQEINVNVKDANK
ncbi:MAG: hypothetical protein IPK62_01410 [Bacteroidetes bacterium]|nr:hypothetical protein [Bacteroidota bacterium]MBK8143732.1 hypothetical protein [Bacteroidota bacterium]MBP6315797.1 hypothetical protein [Chitinophagaceae bacterium]